MIGVLALVALAAARPLPDQAHGVDENSAQMKLIYAEDQADREINMASMTPQQRLDWISKIGPRDGQRRKEVIELISKGSLHTGLDFEEAAFIFQHGEVPDDFLLAHTLATVAIAKGSSKSRWIAAATLDRYLQRIKQPQVYGTQYFIGPNKGDTWTQDPYNRTLIPDALREAMCVPSQDLQQKVVEMLRQGKEPPERKVPGC